MKMTRFMIVAAVMFPLSVAAGDKSTTKESFNKLDKDKNGYITQQEAKDYKELLDKWDTADADANGQLEMSEFSAFESGKAGAFVPGDDPEQPGVGAAPMK